MKQLRKSKVKKLKMIPIVILVAFVIIAIGFTTGLGEKLMGQITFSNINMTNQWQCITENMQNPSAPNYFKATLVLVDNSRFALKLDVFKNAENNNYSYSNNSSSGTWIVNKEPYDTAYMTASSTYKKHEGVISYGADKYRLVGSCSPEECGLTTTKDKAVKMRIPGSDHDTFLYKTSSAGVTGATPTESMMAFFAGVPRLGLNGVSRTFSQNHSTIRFDDILETSAWGIVSTISEQKIIFAPVFYCGPSVTVPNDWKPHLNSASGDLI